jgi:hypothetical protein
MESSDATNQPTVADKGTSWWRSLPYKRHIVVVAVFMMVGTVGTCIICQQNYAWGLRHDYGAAVGYRLGFWAYPSVVAIGLTLYGLVRTFLRPRTGKHATVKLVLAGAPLLFPLGVPIVLDQWGSRNFFLGFQQWAMKDVDVEAIQRWLASDGRQLAERVGTGAVWFPEGDDYPSCVVGLKPEIISLERTQKGELIADLFWGKPFLPHHLIVGPPTMELAGAIRPVKPGVCVSRCGR